MPHSMLRQAYAVLFLSSTPSSFVLEGVESLSLATLQIWIKPRYHLSSTKGEKEIWCATAASGLDKCQCTVQLTIFADGKPRVRPTIISEGKEKEFRRQKKMHGIQGYVSCFKIKLGVTRQS